MLIKDTNAKIQFSSSAAAAVDVNGAYLEHEDGATVATAAPIANQNYSTIQTDVTILNGSDATHARRVADLTITNKDTAVTTTITIKVHDGSAASVERQETLAPGDSMRFEKGSGWTITRAQTYPSTKALGSDHSNSTTSPTAISGLGATGLVPGTYLAEWYIVYQSGATTTGIRFDVNFTGTASSVVWDQNWVDVSATAATAAADQDEILTTGGVLGAFASRAFGTAGRGTTISVDTANADMFMRITALFTVTVAGDLELYHGSEVAAASTVKAGSALVLTRMAA